MEYYANELGISKYGSDLPCSWCSCDMGENMPFKDFRPVAAWKETVITAAASRDTNPCKHDVMKIP
eukprot:413050-Heterocapsa_arctica.AAC.1